MTRPTATIHYVQSFSLLFLCKNNMKCLKLTANPHSPFEDIDGTMKGTKFEEWNNRQYEACAKLGIDSMAAAKRKQVFIDQGFEDVVELKYKWPIGTWPKDPKQKRLGKMTMINTSTGLEGQHFPHIVFHNQVHPLTFSRLLT